MYRITPKRYREKVAEMLRQTGSRVKPGTFVNYSFAVSFAIGFIVAFFAKAYWPFVWLSTTAGVFALFHGILMMIIEKRSSFVDEILPDALQLMATNSRAGYIPSRALMLSTRNEFGPLSDAIKYAGKEIFTGKTLEEGIMKMNEFVKSDMLKRATSLIIEGIKSGGEFASLLDENADYIRRVQAIKKETRARIAMYSIFIAFAGCFAAPILYAMSTHFVGMIEVIGTGLEMPEMGAAHVPFMTFRGLGVSQDFLFMFSLVLILITTMFGSLIIGIIDTGKAKMGIKFMPILFIMAVVMFMLTRVFLGIIFTIA